MKSLNNSIKIVESGGLSISLDYITFGSGSPKTLILSGIHGNERTGNLIIARLMDKLPKFRGTLTILPIVNPLGYSLGQRVEPLSGLDLNRHFTGKNDGRPAYRITNTIMELIEKYDYIINLHNYTTAGLVQVAFSDTEEAKRLASLLKPDVVRVSHTEKEHKLTGSLMGWLKDNNKHSVLVELPTHLSITEEQSSRVIDGIVEHLTVDDKRTSLVDNITKVPFVKIKLVKSPQTGVFYSKTKLSLGCKVKKGDLHGKIVNLPSGEAFKIVSPCDGIICEKELKNEYPVTTGDTLYGIGELISESEKTK